MINVVVNMDVVCLDFDSCTQCVHSAFMPKVSMNDEYQVHASAATFTYIYQLSAISYIVYRSACIRNLN